MHGLRNLEPPKLLLIISVVMAGLIFFQTIYTNAQSSSDTGESARQAEPPPYVIPALTAQLKQASAQIFRLEARLELLENRERTFQIKYLEMVDEMTILRDLTEKAIASTAGNRKKQKSIAKVTRLSGGRPGQKDMVVSIHKFSITWNQMEAVLDKLDEITQRLSQSGS